MADARVVVDAILNASGVTKGVNQIKGQVDGISWKNLEKGDGVASKVANGMKAAGAAIGKALVAGTAAAVTGVAAIGKAALESYASYEQLVGGVETLFGTRGAQSIEEYAEIVGKSVEEVGDEYASHQRAQEQAMQNASQAFKTAGMSANEYMEQTTAFAASLVTSLGGDTEKAVAYADMAVTDMSDNANKMGTDIGRITDAYQGFAKQNYTMLDNLKLGYGGTKGEMERLLKDAEAIKAAHGELAEYSVDSFADIVEAIHVVQDEMGITGTTQKEASATIEGSLKMTKAAYENWLTALGDDNADFEKQTKELVDSALTAFGNILPRLKIIANTVIRALPSLFQTAGSIISELAPVLFQAVEDVFAALLGNISEKAGQQVHVIANALRGLLPVLAGVLSAAVDFVTFALDNLPAVSAAVAGVVSAIAAGKVASALAAWQAATEGVTLAQQLLNATVLANPIGLVVGAVVGLSTAYAAYTQATMAAAAAEYELQGEQREAIDACKELSDSYEQMAAVRDSQVEGISNEYGYLQELRAEYNGLIDENGRVQEGYEERAEFILSTLASAMGVERDNIGELIDSNGKLGDSIDAVLKKKQAEATLAANEQMYNEAIANRGKALQTLKSARDVATQAEQRYQQTQSASKQVLETYNDILSRSPQEASYYLQANGDIIAAAEAAQQAYGESLAAVEEAEAAWVGYNVTVQNYEGLASAIISGDADEINQAMLNMQNDFITAENGNRESLERQVENYRANLASLEQAINDGTPGVTQDMVTQASSMVTAAEAELAKLPGEASAKGVESGGQFASGVGSKSADAADAGKRLATSAEGSMTADTYSSGANFGQGFINGIASTIGGAVAKAREMTQSALAAVRTAQAEGSPSKLTAQSGEFFGQGFAVGIGSTTALVNASAASLASGAIDTMTAELEIHSPSKKAADKVGKPLAQGVAKGVTANKDLLTQAIKGMLEDTTKKSRKRIAKAANSLASGISDAYKKLTRAGYETYAEFAKEQRKWDRLVDKRDAKLKQSGLTWDKYTAKQAEWAKAVEKRDKTLEASGYTWKKFVNDQRKWTEELKGNTSKWTDSTKKSYEKFRKVQESMKGVWSDATQAGYESFQKLEEKMKSWDSKTQKSYAKFQKLANGLKADAKDITKYWNLAAVSLDLGKATKSATKNTKVLNNLYKRTGLTFSESFVETFMNGSEEYQKVFASMKGMTKKQIKAIVESYAQMERAERKEELSARKLAIQYREQMLKVGKSAKDAALDAKEAALNRREALVSVKEALKDTTSASKKNTKVLNNLYKRTGTVFSESFVETFMNGGEEYQKAFKGMAKMTDAQIKAIVTSFEDMERAERKEELSARELALQYNEQMLAIGKSAKDAALDAKEAALVMREAVVNVRQELADATKATDDKTAALQQMYRRTGVVFTEGFVKKFLEGSDDYDKALEGMAKMTDEQVAAIVSSYTGMERAERREALAERELALKARESMGAVGKSAEDMALDVQEAVMDVREVLAGNASLSSALDAANVSAEDLARMIGSLDVTIEDFEAGVASAVQTVSDGFSAMARDSQTSLDGWKSNLANNINEANAYARNLAVVMNSIPDDIDSEAFRQAVYEGGYDKWGQVIADLATKSGEEIAQAIALYNDSVTAGQQAAITAFESLALEPPELEDFTELATATGQAMYDVEVAANSMEKSVGEAFARAYKTIDGSMTDAIASVKRGTEEMSEIMKNAELVFPHVKIPHFSVRGSFSLDPISVPTFSVNWYAKGGIFNGPSVIGVGERGAEMVLPSDGPMMDSFAERVASRVGGGATVTVYIDRFENNTDEDIDELADRVADAVDRKIAEKSRIKAYA